MICDKYILKVFLEDLN